MANHVLKSLLLLLIQPVFISGLIYSFINYRRRVEYTRKTYRVNFVRENFEIKNFLFKGIIPGLVLSLLSVGIGVQLTIEWFILYQLITIVLLLIGGSRLIHPIFTFSLTSIGYKVLSLLSFNIPLLPFKQLYQLNDFTYNAVINHNQLTTNILFIASLILLLSIYLLIDREESRLYPVLRTSKRGKSVAKYQRKSLWLLPLMVIVPGEAFSKIASWWPLLEINGESYALLFMPILVGFHFTISTQLIHEATALIKKDFRYVGLIGLATFIIAYFIPAFSIWGVGLLFLFSFGVLIRHRRREKQWAFRYGPTNEGLRVIAIRSESPADRMSLSVGDTILEMNDTEMNSIEDYNRVVAYNRSYIKMRVLRVDNEIVMVQTPLYDDDFNSLGLLILDN